MNKELAGMLDEASRLRREDRFEAALALLEAAVALARSGNPEGLGCALAALAQIERDRGNRQAAIRHYDEAARLAEAQGDTLTLAHRIRHIGDMHLDAGRLDEAEEHCERALSLYRAGGGVPPLDLANALRPMALLNARKGEDEAAEDYWKEARALYRQAGVQVGPSPH